MTGLVAGLLALPQPALQASAAGVECYTGVYGVLPSGKILAREVSNRAVVSDLTSSNALSVKPTAMSFYNWEDVEGGRGALFDVYVPGTRPRRMQTLLPTDATEFSFKQVSRQARTFSSKLAAQSGSYYVYGVDRSGRLMQWTRYQSRSGALYLANAKLVARGMGGLKTLVLNSAQRKDGVKFDLLYGTTRKGALMQFQVPWLKPGNSKVTTIRRTGFAKVTGLSTSVCNQDVTHGSILAVNRKANTAQWFTLRNQLRPSGERLVNHGRIAKNANWRITAVS